MGLAADFDGEAATPVQRELNAGAREALGEPLNVITIGTWDAMMALREAAETADSLDPKVIAETRGQGHGSRPRGAEPPADPGQDRTLASDAEEPGPA